MKRVTIEASDTDIDFVVNYLTQRTDFTVVKVEDVKPEKHIPKCDPSRSGRHVTLDRDCINAIKKEFGRTFEFRNCIHCGVIVENQIMELEDAVNQTPAAHP
jgi:hypothetical protein